ncbi:hypothetical protein ScPMuIL_010253 [Solemya velum]
MHRRLLTAFVVSMFHSLFGENVRYQVNTFHTEKFIETDHEPFGNIAWNKFMTEWEFTEFCKISFMNCVTECLLREPCESLSYSTKEQQCFLHENSNTTNVEDREGYVYSNITSWPKFLLGPCATHNCSIGKKCVLEDGQPRCEISECVDLPALPNASIPYGHRGVNDTRAYERLRCDVGFTTDWDLEMTCRTEGQWKYHNPPCRPVSCGPSNDILHASKIGNGTVYLATVVYTCTSGYSDPEVTSVTRRCQDDGNWSNETLNCQAVSCGSSEDILNASKIENGTVYPATVVYTCTSGYSDPEATSVTRRCQDNGSWSNETLNCQGNIPQ